MAEDNLASNEKSSTIEAVRPVSLTPAVFGFIIVVVIAVAAYLTQQGVSNSTAWVLHTYDVRSELQNLQTRLAEIRGSALAYSLSRDESQLQLFNEHSLYISAASDHLRKLTADNIGQQQHLNELEASSKNYIEQLQSAASAARTPAGGAPASIFAKSAAIRDLDSQELRLQAALRNMDEEEIKLLGRRLGDWNREFWRTSLVLVFAVLAAPTIFVC